MLRAQTIVSLLDGLATDLVRTSARRLEESGVDSVDAVRARPNPCVGFSETIAPQFQALKRHLFEHFYMHPQVLRRSDRAQRVLGDLFRGYCADSRRLPAHVSARFAVDGEKRAIADYIAGMTDRFAMTEQRRLQRDHEPT